MNLEEIMIGLKYALLSPAQKILVQYHLQQEQAIMKVVSVLPGNYRYDQVEAAINASGVHPDTLYVSLASGESTVALATFYEVLHGSGDEIK